MKVLDLFCGGGGAGMGYHQAGFEVTGVDLKPQTHYPLQFIQCDVLSLPPSFLRFFDLIHASPPCQAHTSMRTLHNARPHLDLIPQTRALLQASGVPYVIENVVGAPLIDPFMLCGTMFGLGAGGAELHRHRIFESSFPVERLECRHTGAPVIGIYGGHVRNRKRRAGSHARGVADFTPDQGREAMGIDWMTLSDLSQAIPPAYTRYIAYQFLMGWKPVVFSAECDEFGDCPNCGDDY